MKCLLQLQPITSGSAKLAGREVGREGREIRKRVGYTPEQNCHIPGMAGCEYVTYPLHDAPSQDPALAQPGPARDLRLERHGRPYGRWGRWRWPSPSSCPSPRCCLRFKKKKKKKNKKKEGGGISLSTRPP